MGVVGGFLALQIGAGALYFITHVFDIDLHHATKEQGLAMIAVRVIIPYAVVIVFAKLLKHFIVK